MNGEWIFQIALVLVSVLVSTSFGYLLGLRSQKMQALREHITEIVKDKYPELFFEIKRSSEYLDNILEEPDVAFIFPKLNEIFDRGFDEFIKRHHEDLFLAIDFFQKNIVPKLYGLHPLKRKTQKR